jgi:autotransporter-associated beta strand protein
LQIGLLICLGFILSCCAAKAQTNGMQYKIPESEYSALVDLYNSTGGSGWVNQSGWLDGDATSWYGVSVGGVTYDANGDVLIPGNVQFLSLEDNQLTGTIPTTLGNLINLEGLGLDHNQLSGTIPTTLGNLTNLQYIELNDNQLTGSIPTSLGNLFQLTGIYLYDNQLTGNIPISLGNLSQLSLLMLSANQLSGTIPSTLSNLVNLSWLLLDDNQLSGAIPSNLGNLTNLELLVLGRNQLSGTIPSTLSNLVNLSWLVLDDNQLSGAIPSNLGNLANLELLNLGDNQLSGTIPFSLASLINLQTIVLDDNQLTGTIPSNFDNLYQLTEMYLSGNQLSGSIPSNLGNLANLEILNLGDNQLSGTIPFSLAGLINLQSIELFDNQLTGSIPSNIDNLIQLTNIDLSGNQLSGSIPSNLGNLAHLQDLTLKQNQLSGAIPSSLGNLINLQDLKLAQNQLNNSIPSSLGNLTNLQHLSLHDNQLTGEVPDLSRLTPGCSITLFSNCFDLSPGSQSLMDIGLMNAAGINPTYLPQNPGCGSQVCYWDPGFENADPGSGGNGSWDNSTTNWWLSGTGDVVWSTGDYAVFASTAGTVTLGANVSADGLTFDTAGYVITGSDTLTLNGPGSIGVPAGNTSIDCTIAGTSGLTFSGSGTLTLSGTNTYSGNTTISAGTLALGSAGSINNSSAISISTGATFDVSAIPSYALSGSTALSANGAGTIVDSTAAVINGASGGTVSLGSQPISLTFKPTAFTGDTNHPSLYISQGTLSLNGNAFTVTNASGTALFTGTYLLIQQAGGSVTSSGSYTVSVKGSGLAGADTASIQVSGGNVNLVVSLANGGGGLSFPSFSGLTASQAITCGTTAVTLAGKVSATGPIYPARGETIIVMINGNAQTTAINDATGDFSFSYNSSTIPASAESYPIIYSYSGDVLLNPAINTNTTLTVNLAQDLFEADFGSGNIYEFTPGGMQTTFASGLNKPAGLVFNSAGILFEADAGSGNIYEFTSGGTQSTFATGLGVSMGAAFNSAGVLFVSGFGSGNIYEFTSGGTQSTFAAGLSQPMGAAFNSAGVLFVSDYGSGIIYAFTNGVKGIFASGLNKPAGLAFNDAGVLFVSDYGSGNIYEFTPRGVQTTFASGLANPAGLAFNSAGVLFEADAGSGNIYEFTSGGTQSTFATGLNSPSYIAFQPQPSALFSSLTPSQSITCGTTSITLAGKVSATGPIYPASGETITVTINGNALTTAINDSTGDFSFSYHSSTIPASANPYPITYFYPGDALLNPATNTSTTLTVTRAIPIITWTNPAPIIYGTTLGSNQLNATVNVPGSFACTPTNGTVLNAGTNTLTVIFTPTDTVDYNCVTDSVSLVVLPASLTVTAANASRAYGQTNPVFSGTITGLTNGDNITTVYSCSATSNSPVGTYPIVPSLVDPGNRLDNYQTNLVSGTLNVIALPFIQTVWQSCGSLNLTWSATTGELYQIQSTTNLAPPNWINLGNSIIATNSTMTVSEPIGANAQQFYRVVLFSGTLALPVIQSAHQTSSSFTFTWSATTNQMYQIESTASLAPANWTNLGGTITATNSTMTNSLPIGTNSQQFYRVVLL